MTLVSPLPSGLEKQGITVTPSPKAAASPYTSAVRFSVLGLAGITVNHKHLKELTSKANKGDNAFPSTPDKMRAVVAVSRTTNKIIGTTDLSKSLTLPSSNQNTNRHVAVWANETEKSLGSLMNFGLKGFETTFKLTIYLTNSDDISSSPVIYALPIGLAKLTLTENMTPDGDTIILDIPIQSPPSKAEMLAVYSEDDSQKETKQKKTKKKKWFGGKKREEDGQENLTAPTKAQQEAFKSVYSIDSSGDAVIRVEFQIIPKQKKADGGNVEMKEIVKETVEVDDQAEKAQTILKELEMQAGSLADKQMYARLAQRRFSVKDSRLIFDGLANDNKKEDEKKEGEEANNTNKLVSHMFQQARGALDSTFSTLFGDHNKAPIPAVIPDGGIAESKEEERSTLSMASLRKSLMKQGEKRHLGKDVINLLQCGEWDDSHLEDDDPFFGLLGRNDEDEDSDEESSVHIPDMIIRNDSMETGELTINSRDFHNTPPRIAPRKPREKNEEDPSYTPVAFGGNGVCTPDSKLVLKDDLSGEEGSLLEHVRFLYFNEETGPRKDSDDAEEFF